MVTRREFIKLLGMLGSILLTPFGKYPHFGKAEQRQEQEYPIDLFGGFVILPYGAKVPDFVEQPKLSPPIFCGVGDGPAITANAISYSPETEVTKSLPFPFYRLSVSPPNLESMGGSIIKYPTGDIYSVDISYGKKSISTDFMESCVSLWTYPEFPRPFPIWLPDPVESTGKSVALEKTVVLPSPGLMMVVPPGLSFHWIENNILYRLIIQESNSLEQVQSIVGSLDRSK